jgi:hypothetical protein
MSHIVEVALLLISIGWIITSLTSLYNVVISRGNSRDIQEVVKQTNGIAADLAASERKVGFAAGEKSERDKSN